MTANIAVYLCQKSARSKVKLNKKYQIEFLHANDKQMLIITNANPPLSSKLPDTVIMLIIAAVIDAIKAKQKPF